MTPTHEFVAGFEIGVVIVQFIILIFLLCRR